MKKKLKLDNISVNSVITEMTQRDKNLAIGGVQKENGWDDSWAMTGCGGPDYCDGNPSLPGYAC